MKNQKFFRGQRVRVADDLGSMLRHFQSGCDAIVVGSYTGCDAIVVGSYTDQYGSAAGEDPEYTLLLKDDGVMDTVSWYEESQLTLVSDDRVRGEEILQRHKKGDDSWLSEK